MRAFCTLWSVLLMVIISGCVNLATENKREDKVSAPLFFWQDEALVLIKKYQLNPLRAARVLAYAHKGMHTVHTRIMLSDESNERCKTNAIEHVASRTLNYFFPLETSGRLIAKGEIRKTTTAVCVTTNAIAEEEFIKLRDAAAQDGAFPPRRLRANAQKQLGSWQATPPVFVANPLEPYAGEWTPFFITQPSSIAIASPPAIDSPAYMQQVNELIRVTNTLTDTQKQAAVFWHLEAGSVTPPGVWNLKIRELTAQTPNIDTSRFFAALNMAMYDALIACWHFKYTYWTERPITAVQRLQAGSFAPLLVTPPFPSYPSGHACVSGAAASVLSAYVPSESTTAKLWAAEAAASRLWGGIHFQFDNEAGLAVGAQVGQMALKAIPP